VDVACARFVVERHPKPATRELNRCQGVVAVPAEEATMSDALWVIGGLVVVVGLLLAVDWFTAARTKRRVLVRARDQGSDDTGIGYTIVEHQARSSQLDTWNP
jgi:hypothetical protein